MSIPPGMPHTFDNLHNGGRPVRALNLMTPGGIFDMFDEMARVSPGPGQADEVSRVAERHGTVLLGPPIRIRLGLQ